MCIVYPDFHEVDPDSAPGIAAISKGPPKDVAEISLSIPNPAREKMNIPETTVVSTSSVVVSERPASSMTKIFTLEANRLSIPPSHS
jgi:hypothetical protein